MRKKLPLIAAISAIALLFLLFNLEEQPKNNRILEANLLAAIALDNNIITTCGTKTFDYGDMDVKAPLFEGLGKHVFTVTTKEKEAQIYFNQGLNLTYGFNHTEAHRSFKEVARISEGTALAYWGQAYTLGPNINDPAPDEQRMKNAYEAISKAVANLTNANELEKQLILALQTRFVLNEDSTFSLDNKAYMEQMEKVAQKFSDNPDVLTLYAASIMNTMPWDYWNRDYTPHDNTLKAKEALEKAISINAVHPGAHHYYIHLTELPFPDAAANSGDALASLMPGAGHMVHMPSHAYIRVGRYKDAAEANLKAIETDEEYISQCYSQGIYPLGYYPHNIHFLWSAATIMGDSKTAIAAARKTAEKVSIGSMTELVFMQEYASVPLQAYVRFGKWNEILTVPYPGDDLKHMKLFWHYSRGMAFIRKGNLPEAKEELDALEEITKDASYDSIYATINNSGDIADLAFHLMAGELFAAQNNNKEADKYFKMAVANEDSLIYTEPPSWHLPTRENYGAFLVNQKRYKEATTIYQENLKELRSNGWALIGLHNAYKGLGMEKEAKETKAKFDTSWQYADIRIGQSAY